MPADKEKDTNEQHAESHGVHEVGGYSIADSPLPRSTLIVFIAIFFLAVLSWISTNGF